MIDHSGKLPEGQSYPARVANTIRTPGAGINPVNHLIMGTLWVIRVQTTAQHHCRHA